MGVSHGLALQLLCLRLGVADVDDHGPPVFVSYVSSAVRERASSLRPAPRGLPAP